MLYYYYGANQLVAQEEYKETQSQNENLNTSESSAIAGTYLLYHFNNVGSTTAVTDEKGNIKYQYQYSPYGELIQGTYGQVAFLYNGQYGVASDDNGLYYMRARYYNIDIKRFINQDVVTGSIERSSSLNRYAYVEGNPISYIDPFGLNPENSNKLHRYDTSGLHREIALASLILIAETAVGVVATSGVMAVAVMQAYVILSNVLAVFDSLLYFYDFCTATNESERCAAVLGMEINFIGYALGPAITGLKSIQSIFSEAEIEVIQAVISYDYNAHVAALSSYLEQTK